MGAEDDRQLPELAKKRRAALARSKLLRWLAGDAEMQSRASQNLGRELFKEAFNGIGEKERAILELAVKQYLHYISDLRLVTFDYRDSNTVEKIKAVIAYAFMTGYQIADEADCAYFRDVVERFAQGVWFASGYQDEFTPDDRHINFWVMVMQHGARTVYEYDRPPHKVKASRDFWNKALRRVDMSVLDNPNKGDKNAEDS